MNKTGPQLLTISSRPLRFTPERIGQIKNLVERGYSRDEIAELLNLSVGSLQVACSRFGISLRRAVLDNGVGLRQRGGQIRYGAGLNHGLDSSTSSQPPPPQHEEDLHHLRQSHAATEHREADSAIFTIRIRYKGEERTTELPLTKAVIDRLALEADLHHLRIDELVSKLIIKTMKKGLLQLVLDL
jgi:hypothetical protein